MEQRREIEVIEAIQFLMPKIDSIHYPTGGQRPGIVVGQRDAKTRLPLESYGEGMRRLLAICLTLVSANHGYLLIDEIDTGFHWTVMADMWQYVIEAAGRSNVQVFATTHSYDCIKGLATLVQSRPELAERLAVQKVDPSLKKAVCIPGRELPIVIEQEIEVR